MTEYFFDFTGGSDSSNGLTPDTAWKTLSKLRTQMTSVITAGDVVRFKRGEVWEDTAQTVLDGLITYTTYSTGSRPRFFGSQLVTGWSLESAAISRYTAAFSGGAPNTFARIFQRNKLTDVVGKGTPRATISVVSTPSDFTFDSGAGILYYIPTGGEVPANIDIRYTNLGNSLFRFDDSNGSIHDWELWFAVGNGLTTNEFNGGATSVWTFLRCDWVGARSHGFQQFGGTLGSRYDFSHCTFAHCGEGVQNIYGLILNSNPAGALVEDCTFHSNSRGALFNNNGLVGVIVRRCSAYSNHEDGISLSVASASGSRDTIEFCCSWLNGRSQNDRSGIASFGSDTVIRYNSCWSNNLTQTTGHGIIVDVGAKSNLVYGNACWDNANAGIAFTDNRHKFYNNTCVNNFCRNAGGQINAFGGAGAVTDFQMKNNILHTSGATQFTFRFPGSIGTPAVHEIDNNLHFNTSVAHVNISWGNSDHSSVASLNASKSIETNGIQANPLFQGSSGGSIADVNFSLRPGSPAINRGDNTVAIAQTDNVGNPWLYAPDIGAFEYQGEGRTDPVFVGAAWVRPYSTQINPLGVKPE